MPHWTSPPVTITAIEPGHQEDFPDGFCHRKFAPRLIIAQAIQGRYEIRDSYRHGFANPGACFIAPAGEPLEITHHHLDGAMRSRWLHLTALVYGTVDISTLRELPLIIEGPLAQRLGEGLGRLLELYKQPQNLNTSVQALAEASSILADLLTDRQSTTQGKMLEIHADNLQPILSELLADLNKPLDPAALATKAGMSRRRLFSLFQSTFGCGPAAWLRRQRIHRACELLGDRTQTLAEIASDTGFSNPFHFSRVFTSITGTTPSAYRANRNLTGGW